MQLLSGPRSGAGPATNRGAQKRALDLLFSGLALLVLSPLFALIAVCIRRDSSGPILFRQVRVGKDGKLFTCLKFRTMYQDADQRVHRLAFQRMAIGHPLSTDPHTPFKLSDDSRVTQVGAWLRRTSLDELPQLFNVLLGDMSLVGPRPAIPYELEHYKPWQHDRHRVKPGITGLWQVYGRGTTSFDEMMALDVTYANTWTLGLDLKLIGLTVPAILSGRGAR